jgi:hypothetical protein
VNEEVGDLCRRRGPGFVTYLIHLETFKRNLHDKNCNEKAIWNFMEQKYIQGTQEAKFHNILKSIPLYGSEM